MRALLPMLESAMSYYTADDWDLCACGRRKKAAFDTCWQCRQNQLEHNAQMQGWQRGFTQGFDEGWKQGQANMKLHPQFVRRLLQLCHPDKHDNSQAATEVTQWLLTQRES